jgi:hypothetical protein
MNSALSLSRFHSGSPGAALNLQIGPRASLRKLHRCGLLGGKALDGRGGHSEMGVGPSEDP